MTRPERLAAAACVLLLLAALCVGCASPRVPAELPHYPCEQVKDGTTQYVACSADEWVHQEILRSKR
ncbi:MAG: hypothetical protein RJA63_3287 [Pseudomonadota bacterium]|jgi:hypothetical protein